MVCGSRRHNSKWVLCCCCSRHRSKALDVDPFQWRRMKKNYVRTRSQFLYSLSFFAYFLSHNSVVGALTLPSSVYFFAEFICFVSFRQLAGLSRNRGSSTVYCDNSSRRHSCSYLSKARYSITHCRCRHHLFLLFFFSLFIHMFLALCVCVCLLFWWRWLFELSAWCPHWLYSGSSSSRIIVVGRNFVRSASERVCVVRSAIIHIYQKIV